MKRLLLTLALVAGLAAAMLLIAGLTLFGIWAFGSKYGALAPVVAAIFVIAWFSAGEITRGRTS